MFQQFACNIITVKVSSVCHQLFQDYQALNFQLQLYLHYCLVELILHMYTENIIFLQKCYYSNINR